MTPDQAKAFIAAHPPAPALNPVDGSPGERGGSGLDELDYALLVPVEDLRDLPPADVTGPRSRIHPADVLVGIALGLVLGAIFLSLWSMI